MFDLYFILRCHKVIQTYMRCNYDQFVAYNWCNYVEFYHLINEHLYFKDAKNVNISQINNR